MGLDRLHCPGAPFAASVHRSAASLSQVDLQPSTAPGPACTPRPDNGLTERRQQAEEFCDVTAVFLESLNQGYPTVIEVREVRFDEWGRRRVCVAGHRRASPSTPSQTRDCTPVRST